MPIVPSVGYRGGNAPIPTSGISRLGSSGSFDGMTRVAVLDPPPLGEKTISSVASSSASSVPPDALSCWMSKSIAIGPWISASPRSRSRIP